MVTYHSQYGQDRLLDRAVFRGMRGGVFVDIGAHDGVSLSNTLTFERDYGWTGLCIEANPRVFPRLAAARNVKSLNLAITDRVGSMPFFSVTGYAEMLSGLVEAASAEHRARAEREVARHGGSVEVIDVPTTRLDRLLAEEGIREVHYLSVDTEGGEAAVLATLDHSETFIHVIGAECDDHRLAALRALLGDEFLLAARHHEDVFFVNRRSPFAAQAGRLARWSLWTRARRRLRRLTPAWLTALVIRPVVWISDEVQRINYNKRFDGGDQR